MIQRKVAMHARSRVRRRDQQRSILRLATWELRQGELPAAVIIDQAMELAKRYAGAEAAPFVNGVLGAIARGGAESR